MVTKGVYLAQRLVKAIQALEKVKVPAGVLDITLYADDVAKKTFAPAWSRQTLA